MDVKLGFSGQKNVENDHTHQLRISKFFSERSVIKHGKAKIISKWVIKLCI